MFLQYKRASSAGLVVLAALSLGAIRAQAQDAESQVTDERGEHHHFLTGDYGLVTSVSCAYSDQQAPGVSSINPTTGEFLVNGEPINLAGMGTVTFNRDGTLKLAASGEQIETNKILAGHVPVLSGFQSLCDGSYTVEADGKQLSLTFTCAITVPGQPIKLKVGPVTWDGFIGANAQQIHMNGRQNVQNIAISLASNGQPVGEQQRICMQVSSLDRL